MSSDRTLKGEQLGSLKDNSNGHLVSTQTLPALSSLLEI